MTNPTLFFPDFKLAELLDNTIETDGGCLEWQGSRQRNYGAISHKGRTYAVHRITCFLVYGEPKPKDFALHACDNPPCINPEHLRWGSQKENMADSISRNRRAVVRGIKNGRAKLDDKKVVLIRLLRENGFTTLEIADLFGVSNQIISRICKREAWTHVENR